MKTVSLTINGDAVTSAVEPRTQLADFLREQQFLTGTHLGCEQGVCGACTVVIDGEIARSCIALAVSCDGAEVRTIEDFDDDALMAELRQAFSAEHGLQCGYCTPGMLITARDIVRRVPQADEARIRIELSGNLCRCTGYVGIVRAIKKVIEARRARGEAPPEEPRVAKITAPPATSAPATAKAPAASAKSPADDRAMTTLQQSFVVQHPRDKVWAYFGQIGQVARCMPGVSLDEPVEDAHVLGQMRVKLGPISAAFAGEADIQRDDAAHRGVIDGSGRDSRSASSAKGRVTYELREEQDGAATRIDVSVSYALTGALAQFGRGGIVRDLANRLTDAFAKNLEARLGGQEVAEPAGGKAEALDAGSLLFSVLGARLREFFARLLGQR